MTLERLKTVIIDNYEESTQYINSFWDIDLSETSIAGSAKDKYNYHSKMIQVSLEKCNSEVQLKIKQKLN